MHQPRSLVVMMHRMLHLSRCLWRRIGGRRIEMEGWVRSSPRRSLGMGCGEFTRRGLIRPSRRMGLLPFQQHVNNCGSTEPNGYVLLCCENIKDSNISRNVRRDICSFDQLNPWDSRNGPSSVRVVRGQWWGVGMSPN